ncbi:MAG TPA: hypothetical protein PK668_23100 [Myxococcota bacterium]|nr:hypothetical protein [Myxococcota bacterium]HRY95584.1 hypothetical protein [Myxococcota bacterium]HSA24732.1 hypothetical protein [Myxococcota bacterium]
MAKNPKRDAGSWSLTTWLVAILLVIGIGAGARFAWPHLRPMFEGATGGLGASVGLRLNRGGRLLSPGGPLGAELALAGDVPAFQVTGVDLPFLSMRLCSPGATGARCEPLLHGPTPGPAAWVSSQAQLLAGDNRLELVACPDQAALGLAVAAPDRPPPGCRAASVELEVRP